MKSFLFLLCFSILIFKTSAQVANHGMTYNYFVNLNKVKHDRLSVILKIEKNYSDTLVFCLPKIVPGIYGAMDFGQYIRKIQFLADDISELKFIKLDKNRWKVFGAKKLKFVKYLVDDSWDSFDAQKKGYYYSAGSNFDKQAFIINNNCLFGYFQGNTTSVFKIKFIKPKNLFGATSLTKLSSTLKTDTYFADSYAKLVDNPIMYAAPDTSYITLPNIKVLVACKNTGGNHISKEIAQHIKPLLESQNQYLNGKMPVSNYTFLIYHNVSKDPNNFIGDGLEHSNSTLLLSYSTLDINMIKLNVYSIASHEFFHTLMPLGIHSKEIENYDFNEPKFSKHLWLYEGMTEYFTIHMPVKSGTETAEDFYKQIEKKYAAMQNINSPISITALSSDVMNHQDIYYDVYLKGALINLCLDIELRKLSNGKLGVQDIVQSLLEKYGPKKAFEDEQLFDEIVTISGFPQLKTFFDNYVKNNDPLPLAQDLQNVGLVFEDGKIHEMAESTPEQLQLRKFWINK